MRGERLSRRAMRYRSKPDKTKSRRARQQSPQPAQTKAKLSPAASVPVQNSLLLANALEECDVPYELHLFAKGQHGMSTCTNEVNTPNKHNNAWLPLCMGWLGETLDFTL